jgi:parallel beta-helix repeat protein
MKSSTYGRIVVVVLAALALTACPYKREREKPAVLYVNAVTGSDTNPGTQASPLKTLTRAMRLAGENATVQAAPGVYNAQNGEIFPILVREGVKLIGDEANKGGGSTPTSIVGGGLAPLLNGTVSAALVPDERSTVAGFTITNNATSTAVLSGIALAEDAVTLRNNTVTSQNVGVYVGSSTNHLITGNKIVNNQGSGLGFIAGGLGSKVENNVITGNGMGVKYMVPGGDLGGGSAGSAGGNTLSCNTQNNLDAAASFPISISAAANAWDHSSPTLGCSAGNDICDANAGTANAATINSSAATQAASNCGAVTWFVAEAGLDTNPGTLASPFKTITHATTVATSGSTIQVAPGNYDDANGEVFPIAVPDGVLLIGDETNKGAATVPTAIVGGGQVPGFATGLGAAVLPGTGSTIAGFTITNNNAGLTVRRGLVLPNSGVTLRNNTVTGATHQMGVYIDVAGNHIITGNRIVGNGPSSGIGLDFGKGGVGSKVENNVITGNGVGVEYDAAGGDLGGGSAGSAGGNVLSCNSQADLLSDVTTAITISAANNLWDHVSPTVSCGFTGGDICDFGTSGFAGFAPATIVTTGSAQTTNPAPCP